MSVIEIEHELEKMTNAERRIVIEIAAKLINKDAGKKVVSRLKKNAQNSESRLR